MLAHYNILCGLIMSRVNCERHLWNSLFSSHSDSLEGRKPKYHKRIITHFSWHHKSQNITRWNIKRNAYHLEVTMKLDVVNITIMFRPPQCLLHNYKPRTSSNKSAAEGSSQLILQTATRIVVPFRLSEWIIVGMMHHKNGKAAFCVHNGY